MNHVYIIHENEEWVVPLKAELTALGAPFKDWHMNSGHVDLSEQPPEGVFYNRMSASSHTRGHRYAPEYTAVVLAWLEDNNSRIINGSRALSLELSKALQDIELNKFGIRTPKTVFARSRQDILAAAAGFDKSFITKHNRAGKGLGVRLFHDHDTLQDYVNGVDFEDSVDGIHLIQEYIEAPQSVITRMEFIGGAFLYAVEVDTSDGFELCPADVCNTEDQFLPGVTPGGKFTILEDPPSSNIQRYQNLLRANDIEIAGIEFITDQNGQTYTYDINTNTNYNPAAEAASGHNGMKRIAEFLFDELNALRHPLRRTG